MKNATYPLAMTEELLDLIMAGTRPESAAVAPTGSRLYRRLVIGERLWSTKQAASPRYSRLPVGATFLSLAIMRIAGTPGTPKAWTPDARGVLLNQKVFPRAINSRFR